MVTALIEHSTEAPRKLAMYSKNLFSCKGSKYPSGLTEQSPFPLPTPTIF